MKKKNIIVIVFIIISVILMGIGVYIMNSKKIKTNEKNKKEIVSLANITTDVKYQESAKVPTDNYIAVDSELIKKTSENIGFKMTFCQEKYCTASVTKYKDDKYQDNLTISYDTNNPNSIGNITTMLYYSIKDFSYDTLYKDVNAIIGSYIGIEIKKEELEKIKIPTKAEEFFENNYTNSKFTIQMSLQYDKAKGLYVYRNFIIETDKFK